MLSDIQPAHRAIFMPSQRGDFRRSHRSVAPWYNPSLHTDLDTPPPLAYALGNTSHRVRTNQACGLGIKLKPLLSFYIFLSLIIPFKYSPETRARVSALAVVWRWLLAGWVKPQIGIRRIMQGTGQIAPQQCQIANKYTSSSSSCVCSPHEN